MHSNAATLLCEWWALNGWVVRGCCSVIWNVIAIWTGDKGPEKTSIISAHESLGEQTSRFSKVSLFFFQDLHNEYKASKCLVWWFEIIYSFNAASGWISISELKLRSPFSWFPSQTSFGMSVVAWHPERQLRTKEATFSSVDYKLRHWCKAVDVLGIHQEKIPNLLLSGNYWPQI